MAPGALLGGALALLLLLGHHRRHAAAAGRAVEQADRRDLQLHRQLVEVEALGADGAVGVAAARREVVGADDAVRPSIVPEPPTWLAGRERGDAPVLVVAGEPGEAADLAERARRRAAGRCARGTSACRGRAGARRPGSSEPGAKRAAARPCSSATSSSTGSHVSSRGRLERRRRRRPGATTATTWSWATESPGCSGSTPATVAGARRRHDRLHLHRADDHQGVAGAHARRPRRRGRRPRAAHRARHALLTGADVEPGCRHVRRRGRAGARVRSSRSRVAWPSPRRRTARTARAPRRAASCGRHRARTSGWARIAASWARFVGSPPTWNSCDGPPGPVDGVGDVGRRRPCRSPSPAAGRTAAAARSRRSRTASTRTPGPDGSL